MENNVKNNKLVNNFDYWVHKNRIFIMFNVFGTFVYMFFIMLSGLGSFQKFEPEIIKIPDGTVYTPRNKSKNPWIEFELNGKKYSTDCISFKYKICKIYNNQELKGKNVLFLLPYPNTYSGLILEGIFLSDRDNSFTVYNHQKREDFLKKVRVFEYIGIFFRYGGVIYFILINSVAIRLVYIKFFKIKKGKK